MSKAVCIWRSTPGVLRAVGFRSRRIARGRRGQQERGPTTVNSEPERRAGGRTRRKLSRFCWEPWALRFRFRGQDAQGLLQRGDGFLGVAQRDMDTGEHLEGDPRLPFRQVTGSRRVFEGPRATIGLGDEAFEPCLGASHVGEVMPRRESDHLVEIGFGPVQLALAAEELAAFKVGLGVVRGEADRLFQVGQSVVHLIRHHPVEGSSALL